MAGDDALTTPAAVQAKLLRPLTDLETSYIAANIADVSDQLRSALLNVDDRIAAWDDNPRPLSALNPTKIANVLAGAIAKFLVNPRGLWSRTDSDGPHSASETYRSARAEGAAAIDESVGPRVTASDIATILGASPLPPFGTIRLGAGLLP